MEHAVETMQTLDKHAWHSLITGQLGKIFDVNINIWIIEG